MENKYIIYGLHSSENDKIKYVGMTKQVLAKRLRAHIYDSTHPLTSSSYGSYKSRWIRKVIESGYDIKIIELEIVEDDKDCDEKEKKWISHFGRRNLTNGTDGGRDAFPIGSNKKDIVSIPEVKRYLQRNIRGWFLNVSLVRYAISEYETVNEPLDKYFVKTLQHMGFDYKVKDVVNLRDLEEKMIFKSIENLKKFLKENPESFSFEYQLGAFKEIYSVPDSKRIFKRDLKEIIEENLRR